MSKQASQSIKFYRYRPSGWETIEAQTIVETPVSLTVNSEQWLTFMCTPTDLEALAVGFLFNEGLLETAGDIADVRVCDAGDNVDVWTNRALVRPDIWRRTSGCSGGATANEDPCAHLALAGPDRIAPQTVLHLIERLLRAQELYRSSRGVHSSALSDGERLLVQAEDVGRHNTLDKIAGRCLLDGLQPERRILLTTGRISSDMLQKAGRMGVPIVVSRTAPNALSIENARETGITLIGYARCDQFQVYTHPERIEGAPPGISLETVPSPQYKKWMPH